MMHSYWGMGWGMWFIPLLVILVIFILVIYLLIKNNSQTKSVQGSETLMEILKKRYARGEITKEQFEEMKKDIT